MFEHIRDPLAPLSVFIKRALQGAALGLVLIAITLIIGMLGYHHYEKMSWLDAFLSSAMIISGMGPMGPLQYTQGKIFAGFYALFCGLVFIIILGIIFAPTMHRALHKFHMIDNEYLGGKEE